MKTVGLMLKEARISKGLTPADVERAIRIREKYILAIENDDFSLLPSTSYAKGFVRNYGDFLGLPTDAVMAFFRRQMTDMTKTNLVPKGVSDPLNAPFFRLTPGRFVAMLIGILLIIFLAYLGNQYFRIGKPPQLLIAAPQNNQMVTDTRIAVEGKTDPDATVMINGVSAIVRDDGKFYDRVAIEPGVNKITITATSKFGKTTTVVREVGYQQ